jgi:hypothetical protein
MIAMLFMAGGYSQTYDVKFVNGEVVELEPRKESCPSGWVRFRDNHCTEYRTRQVKTGETCSGTGNNRVCTPTYTTEYNYDFDWERRYFVHADYAPHTDETYEIPRIDRQGVNTPPAFAAVNIGDPTTSQRSFTNYIRAASRSLFAEEAPGEEVTLAYPSIHNQWMSNRVIVANREIRNELWQEWNADLMQLNTDIRQTGANAIIILTDSSMSFSEMLARRWEAHNINDVVVTVGMDGDSISWVDVRSWSSDSMVNIAIRDGILDLGVLDKDQINAIVKASIEDHFKLRTMEEFDYLAEEITPPVWVMVLAGIILLIVTPAITYVFHRNDVI